MSDRMNSRAGVPVSQGSVEGGGGSPALARTRTKSWEKFSQWVSCMCVVTFDLELGQAIETVIPEDYKLSDVEKTNICYLAFPDSNSGCMGDTQFHFRLRCSGSGGGGTDLVSTRDHNTAPLVLTPDPTHYYGFAYFRQVKDSDIRRGYFQKSVVIITRLPYITFFNHVIQKIAPDYFTNGIASLEAACYNMNQWSRPLPGHVLQLPLLGQLFHVRLPSKSDKPGSHRGPELDIAKKSPAMVVVPAVHDLNLYQSLQPVLSNFETIWELVITNEPLVVMASSPTLCGNTVQSLVSLIHPLKYAADFRPFFTIHDSEFKHYTTRTQAPPQVILGVTNPFFVKTLDHWPHAIRLADNASSDDIMMTQRSRSPGEGSADSKPGLHSKYKPFLNKDKSFAKMISSMKGAPGKRPLDAHNAMIKRHALEITTSFIIPLERYFASLMPLKKDVSPWRPPPQLKPFDMEQFLTSMEGTGPHLTTGIKGNWTGLYRRFVNSPNFAHWFMLRKEEANQKLRLLHLDTLCKADMAFWIRGKQEVEIVDFLIQVKESMSNALRCYPSVPGNTLQALQTQVRAVLEKLPEDLQSCLQASFASVL